VCSPRREAPSTLRKGKRAGALVPRALARHHQQRVVQRLHNAHQWGRAPRAAAAAIGPLKARATQRRRAAQSRSQLRCARESGRHHQQRHHQQRVVQHLQVPRTQHRGTY